MNETALREMLAAVKRTEYWLYLGVSDIRRKYIRTAMGPIWSILNSVLFVLIVGGCYSLVFHVELKHLLPHLAAGYFTWLYITSCITESSTLIGSNGIVIKTSRITPSQLILRMIAKNTTILLQNTLIALVVCWYFLGPSITAPLALVGIAAISLFLTGFCFLVALMCARYRDIEPMIQNVLMIFLFITPILWMPSTLAPEHRFLVELNPVYHFIQLVRQPLLGEVPELLSYAACAVAIVAVNSVLVAVYSRYRSRLAYWV